MFEIQLKEQIYHGGSRNPTSYIQNVTWFDVRDGVIIFNVEGKKVVTPITNLEYLREV